MAKPGAILLLLLVALAARAQRPLLPVPVQATWETGYYRFATAPLLALRKQVSPSLPAEGYRLRVGPTGAALVAGSAAGVQRGIATFRQVLESTPRGWRAQYCTIEDQPRFAWRGLLVDAARHFLPVAVIKRNLDGMAAVKLNVLHWHLSDDQAFRVESHLFPRLNQASTDKQFYTRAQVREVLAYAAARGIRVVPEFDMPSHTTSWIVAYPRLASVDSTYAPYQLWRTTNVAIDPTRRGTYAFIDSLLTEMIPLFPDRYFHTGGDENDGRQWRRTPRIVAFMRAHGQVKADGITPDKHLLQLYFSQKVDSLVRRHGKIMIGWDEVLGPNLPPDVVVQSWRGPKALVQAVQQGHPALYSAGYYLDLNYPAARHYAADPTQGVPDSLQSRVLGGEAAMWSEFADSTVYDSRVWPRAAAVAERLWSPAASSQDVPDLYRRLAVVSDELEALGLRHRRAPAALLRQLAAPYPAALPALQTLAAIVEPVKDYKRHFQGFKYTTETPLTRLVDAAPAESDVARRFGLTADSLLREVALAPLTSATAAAAPAQLSAAGQRQLAALQRQVATWQQATTELPPLLVASPNLTEYAPLAAQLGVVCELLSQRFLQLQQGQAPLPAWVAAAKVQLEAAAKPAGQAELAIIGAAKRLVGVQ
ncbi:family 20 glycosylhydrolase [Hymenobacter sp. RP-2-7]|uniref:Family 20 glycosylhydrolase n=1 Tax=Hymenobacter polaris TaxID=2682546 RepID=A0A7Y0FPN7_9BACT|nr:family 20 glycosylhydrolase [Hymenobacter polaris]NML67755.1 family 20 glycosylhydrolase [Hymenobacter polaris]